MIKYFKFLVVAASLVIAVSAESEVTSPIQQCEGENFDDLAKRIKVDPCGTAHCKLTKLTNTTVAFKFKPTEKVKTLINDVYADILSIRFPFIGVTGLSACENVFYADTNKRARCPLEPGIEYIYENVFLIERLYPTVDLKVHWSLKDGDRVVICFEVPARIVKAKIHKKPKT